MKQPAKSRKTAQKRGPLIYLVDDEPLLLDLADVTLQENYTTKKFDNPEQALKSFLKESRKPALLITDYAMGKMNGIELIARCKEVYQELKTMLLSGTAGAEIVLNAPVKVDRFLGKPYQPVALLDAVHQLLGDKVPA